MIRYYLRDEKRLLTRGSEYASGYDLQANFSRDEMILESGQRWSVCTGLYLEMSPGIEGQVRSRSGLSLNHGVIVLNAPGTIDADYRGEVRVTLINLGQSSYVIRNGDKIAQLVFAPVIIDVRRTDLLEFLMRSIPMRVWSLDDLTPSNRGTGGHGSTGR